MNSDFDRSHSVWECTPRRSASTKAFSITDNCDAERHGQSYHDAAEVEKMARLMVFNALAHNRDDHAKNFAFLGDSTGWRMAPAYDLTFSSTSGRGNEHTTAFAGAGKPSIKALKKVCQSFSFLKPQLYLEQTLDAFAGWAEVSKALDLDKTHSANVLRALNEVWKGL